MHSGWFVISFNLPFISALLLSTESRRGDIRQPCTISCTFVNLVKFLNSYHSSIVGSLGGSPAHDSCKYSVDVL